MTARRPIVVVGSGASAVHFAQGVLEKGREVLMLDVGRQRPRVVLPEASFAELKHGLDDPAAYFLGDDFESFVAPDYEAEYYGFPPSKTYVFETVAQHRTRVSGFAPLSSFAQGGLAEAWTGGVYPFNEAELADYPFEPAELLGHYERVAARIGVSGAVDDLARFLPVHGSLLPPLPLDEHSERLLATYDRRRGTFHRDGCFVGRSRLATLSEDKDGRAACRRLGRCLWGCPTESLYTPSITLRALLDDERFTYVDGRWVRHFEVDDGNRVRAVVTEPVGGGAPERTEVGTLVLGAGTLASSRIVLESIRRAGGGDARLAGLMDNRQLLVPFVNLGLLGRPWDGDTYQYHQLNMSLATEAPREYVHGQITTLKTALIHPIVQSVPFDLATSLRVFRHLHAALGLLNVNLYDTRREANCVSLEGEGDDARLVVHYEPPADEPARLRRVLRRYRRALWKLRCVVPPGMTHVRPMGASVHYAGTMPMTADGGALTLTPECRSRDFENLYVVDGTGLPFLPAKNLTFTLMANASRVAEVAF